MFHVYIVTNKPQGTLYIGHTDCIARRVWEHQEKMLKGFTWKYNLDKLVWYSPHDSRRDALEFEDRLKNWRRSWKIALIETDNPSWTDLSYELTGMPAR